MTPTHTTKELVWTIAAMMTLAAIVGVIAWQASRALGANPGHQLIIATQTPVTFALLVWILAVLINGKSGPA